MPNCFADTTAIDDELSNRWIDLDPAGYALIKVDHERARIEAAHFLNTIDDDGAACAPATGEPIPCDGSYKPSANAFFAGRTAKELSVRILEEERGAGLVTMLVHANYLGREFQRAEACLASGAKSRCCRMVRRSVIRFRVDVCSRVVAPRHPEDRLLDGSSATVFF